MQVRWIDFVLSLGESGESRDLNPVLEEALCSTMQSEETLLNLKLDS